MSREQFLNFFKFQPALHRFLGVERKFFLFDPVSKKPVPKAPEFLEQARNPRWTHELSACQVEDRTNPCATLGQLEADLRRGWKHGSDVARQIGTQLTPLEVGPEDMPLDVYPFEPRYSRIVDMLSPDTLLAALRVTGTHIHYGVSSIDEALAVSNALTDAMTELVRLGDGSAGQRLVLYSCVAKYLIPPRYLSVDHYLDVARTQGFLENPKRCWHLIRINPQGTVETRVFGTAYREEPPLHEDLVLSWAKKIRQIVGD